MRYLSPSLSTYPPLLFLFLFLSHILFYLLTPLTTTYLPTHPPTHLLPIHPSHDPTPFHNPTKRQTTDAPTTQGASPREILLECCRRNNTALLSELLGTLSSVEAVAQLLNTATDGVGGFCLHVAAGYGSCRFCSLYIHVRGGEGRGGTLFEKPGLTL